MKDVGFMIKMECDSMVNYFGKINHFGTQRNFSTNRA
jgi:hypothetical protein